MLLLPFPAPGGSDSVQSQFGDPGAAARALFDSARVTDQTHPGLSLRFAHRGLDIARVLGDSRLIAAGYQLAGEAHFQLGNNDSAETCFRTALDHAQAVHSDSLTGVALNSLGLVFYLRTDYEQAYDRCNRALRIAQRAGLRKLAVRAYNYIGLSSQYLSREHNDISYFLIALPQAVAIGDTDGIAITHNHIANSYGSRGMWDSALAHYRIALGLRERIESNTNAIAVLLNNMGNALRSQGDYERAKDYYDRSLAISNRTESKNLVATTYKNLAILMRTMKNYGSALEYARKAKDLSQPISLNRIALQSTEEIARSLAELGDYRGAYQNLQAYLALKDSLEVEVTRRRAAELQIRFESERRERQIQELALSQEQTFRNFLIAVAGLALVAGLGMFWLYRQKSRAAHETALQKAELEHLYGELVSNNARLQQSESELRNSLQEKEVLLKEIHHRVKNNLQIISSLLNLQSLKVQNDQAQSLLRESQDRIRSMALIHERLYSSNDFAQIELRGYLEDLVKYLRNSYDAFHAAVTVEAESVSLPLDTAIPLGLIVSELVTNAFKHGLTPGSRGLVTISAESLEGGECKVAVRDSGKGLPHGFNIEAASTLGLQLVQILTRQLGGHLVVTNENGTCFTVTFPVPVASPRKNR